jgi:hypothetical protein
MYNKLLVLFSLLTSLYLSAQPRSGIDYISILKRSAQYSTDVNGHLPKFSYQSSNSPALQALRKKFNLDSIAGFGNETSRLLNILHWVHNTVRHDGQNESGIKNINADEIITVATEKNIGVSCGELATTLNDCYLSMGWKSRKIYCFPKDSLKIDRDSHVINMVYLSSKKKWIWVDPTNDAYVMDEKGELLSIEEVRERLIANKPLIVNPDANWNHKSSMTKEYYLDTYMAKNLYRFFSPLHSEYDYETWQKNKMVVYVYLFPQDHIGKPPFKTAEYYNEKLKTIFITYNIDNQKLFWQEPVNNE